MEWPFVTLFSIVASFFVDKTTEVVAEVAPADTCSLLASFTDTDLDLAKPAITYVLRTIA